MGLRAGPDLQKFHLLNTTLSALKPVICRKTEEICGEKGCGIRILRLRRLMRRPPDAAPGGSIPPCGLYRRPGKPDTVPSGIAWGKRPWGEALQKAAR